MSFKYGMLCIVLFIMILFLAIISYNALTPLVVYSHTCHARFWNGSGGSFTINDSDTTAIAGKEVKRGVFKIEPINENLWKRSVAEKGRIDV